MQETGSSIIPRKNDLGFYEIRLESIGGLGANLAGKILAQAGILHQGLNGSSFASYGSEKKGSAVKSFIRFCDENQEVLINSPIENPHLVAVFHEALLSEKNTVAGLVQDGYLIVNTADTPQAVMERLGISGVEVVCIDAMKIAIEEKVKINTIMLGAVSAVIDFIDPDGIKDVIRETLGRKYAHLVEANLKAFDRGRAECSRERFPADAAKPIPEFERSVPLLGYENAPIGGAIETPGNSALKDLSLTRSGYVPMLDMSKCIHCGECDMTCPDYCFSWEKRVDDKGREKMFLKGIDYRYCKGCLKCVEICSPGALTEAVESMVELIGVPQLEIME
jgi:pyruvate ferredoxin oxidoreductase gamma subunit